MDAIVYMAVGVGVTVLAIVVPAGVWWAVDTARMIRRPHPTGYPGGVTGAVRTREPEVARRG